MEGMEAAVNTKLSNDDLVTTNGYRVKVVVVYPSSN
jgi:hypothetical protein